MYKRGDTVSHAYHGIGTIKAIEEKEILGSKLEFAILYFEREGLRLSIPRKDLKEQVRDILTEDEAREVMEYLSDYDEILAQNWKARSQKNQERLTSGDPKQICVVAKGLIRLQQTKKNLSTADRQQLQRALSLLAEELGRVLQEEPDVMEVRLREACLDSLAA